MMRRRDGSDIVQLYVRAGLAARPNLGDYPARSCAFWRLKDDDGDDNDDEDDDDDGDDDDDDDDDDDAMPISPSAHKQMAHNPSAHQLISHQPIARQPFSPSTT